MTEDEQKVKEIFERVNKTFKQGVGCISADDFHFLIASRESWRIIAKHNGALARLTPNETIMALDKALDKTTEDWLQALDEIEELKLRLSQVLITH